MRRLTKRLFSAAVAVLLVLAAGPLAAQAPPAAGPPDMGDVLQRLAERTLRNLEPDAPPFTEDEIKLIIF